MTQQLEAMKLALEALVKWTWIDTPSQEALDAITALRQAIEQAQKQEPVAWTSKRDLFQMIHAKAANVVVCEKDRVHTEPLYTSPQQNQPKERTGGCTLCGHCAATGEPIQRMGKQEPVAYVAQVIEALYENSDPVSVEAAEYLEKHTSPPQRQPEQEPVACPDDFELLPVDPTPEMKSAAIEVELFDHDTGKDYVLSWEEAEQIYSAMLNAAPTPPQRQPLTDEQIEKVFGVHNDGGDYYALHWERDITRAIEAAHGITGEKK